MAVERLDVNIQSYIQQSQASTQKEEVKGDESEAARKAAEKKIALKKDDLKSSTVQREVFTRQADTNQKMQQMLGGSAGGEVAQQLGRFENNQQLQSKLTDAQKQMFREAVVKNPPKGAETANAMNNLAQTPGFGKAVNNSQQMGTLLKGMTENPKAEQAASQMLQGRFMQSPKADSTAKADFLRFGLQQGQKGNLDATKKAGDMLGTLTANGMPRGTQRAAMNMVQRQPTDGKAMSNVDSFASNPNVGKMPSFARGKATELLAKSGGGDSVKEGFEGLAADGKFKAQTAQNKGRFFSTIGTGRPSEYRAISDKLLTSLQSSEFPNRGGQVGKFLQKVSTQVQKGGAEGIDTGAAMKASKSSPLPAMPKLVSTDPDMDPEEAARARSQNRGQIMQYFNKLQRMYEGGEKKLNSAKYLEDVNGLNNLREPPALDTSSLTPEEQAFIEERHESVMGTLNRVRTLQKQKARELRTKRMPPAKRRAEAAKRRAVGKQPKYFNPNAGRVGASQSFLQAAAAGMTSQPGIAANPGRAALGQRSAAGAASGLDVGAQVSQALAQLGGGAITADKAGRVAQAIAQSVAQQVAAQVTQSLLGNAGLAGSLEASSAPMTEAAPPRGQQGKVDGWGIPRSFERDLGGSQNAVVKPRDQVADAGPSIDPLAERYTGKTLIKDPSSIRGLDALFAANWKSLGKPEMALLKNLGWNQQTWDTKDTPAAKWPMTMMTPFVSLTPLQREAVRKLGFSAPDWDKRIQGLSMGKNA